MKKYMSWIIIGAIVLFSVAMQYFYVGGLVDNAQKEHEEVANKVSRFDKFEGTITRKVPTPKDLEIGDEYLEEIHAEGDRTAALLRDSSAYLNQGIVDGDVVYGEGHPKAGQPIPGLVYGDYLAGRYLSLLASVENQLAKAMTPAWATMMAQSVYATNPLMSEGEAAASGREMAPWIAARLAHIYTPRDLIPISLTDNFNAKEVRWKTWREYLVAKDILERVVAKTQTEVDREVLSYEREDAKDFDPAAANLKTEVRRAVGARFIENIGVLEVKLIAIGNAELPGEGESVSDLSAGVPDIMYFDTFEVRLEMFAHLKVVDAFMREMLLPGRLIYVPQGLAIERIPDQRSMGNYSLPTVGDIRAGELPRPVEPTQTYRMSSATPVDPLTGFERESPVKATLVYRVYRARVAGAANATFLISE